ncbi:MAG TPA: hypothetical protein VKG44_06695 [Candidatus Baltobacteraceae bacterium]|nr:hypothetical protein [Candidatus Baltobacteraceae bacterium]
MLKRSLTALGAGLILAALAPVAPIQAASNPIQIEQCFVTTPKMMSKTASGTQIVWVNRGAMAATHVTFAVGYRNSATNFLRRVTDDGNFAPGVTVNHHYALYNDVTYAGKATHGCSAVKVVWANGTSWSP